jgi:hypothetical protein
MLMQGLASDIELLYNHFSVPGLQHADYHEFTRALAAGQVEPPDKAKARCFINRQNQSCNFRYAYFWLCLSTFSLYFFGHEKVAIDIFPTSFPPFQLLFILKGGL